MSDPLFDNVKELLDKEKGDERILKQILRACQNNEVISNYERNYVKKLAEKYLGQKPYEDKVSIEKPSPPDVILPETTQKHMSITTEPPKITKSKSKNTKLMLGIGGLSLIIVIVAVMSTGLSDITNPDVTKPVVTSQPESSFLVDTDLNSYVEKDIISIQGRSENSDFVNLSIENQNGVLIWSEQVKTKNDGRFSTLTIAGGVGWEKSGTFTLKAEDDSQTKSKTFRFTT